MNRMRTSAIVPPVRRTLLSVTFVVAFAAVAAGQATQSVVVEHVSFGDFPVEIIGLEMAGVPYKLSESQPRKFVASFDAPEDWLRRLAFRVKNKTDKTILTIKLNGSLATGAEGEVPMGFDVRYGQELDESAFTGRAPRGEPRQLPPGETANAQWTEMEYSELIKFLALKHPEASGRQLPQDAR